MIFSPFFILIFAIVESFPKEHSNNVDAPNAANLHNDTNVDINFKASQIKLKRRKFGETPTAYPNFLCRLGP